MPSEAAAIAENGDTVEIESGTYFDCAVWRAGNLTIAGKGPNVVITDTTCNGKALFVILGDGTTIRNITFTRARVPDENGAGIRAEGSNLTVEGSRFIDNEAGVLAGDLPTSVIRISDSDFSANGKCRDHCAHSLAVGRVALLDVRRSRFSAAKGGNGIVSAAQRTELTDDEIADGSNGASSYLVAAYGGGALVMTGNRLEKGPKTGNRKAAVLVEAGLWASAGGELRFTGNHFTNDSGGPTVFVLNWTDRTAVLDNNVMSGPATEISSKGKWKHRAYQALVQTRDMLRHMAGALLRW